MSRRIISLVLVLVLCLGLCACGSALTEEQMAIVAGTWYLDEYQEKGENPGYFELKTDGTGSFNGLAPLTWTAKVNRDVEGMLIVTIKMETKEKYSFELYTGDPNYIDANLAMGENGPYYHYLKANTNVEVEWFSDICTEWDTNSEDTEVQTVQLNKDGTVNLDGQTYFWTDFSYQWNEDEQVHLGVYNADGVRGTINVGIRDNGLYDFNFHDNDMGWGSNYFDHPMLNMISNGSWQSFDRNTMIDDNIGFPTWYSTSTIADVEYDIVFDTKADAGALTVNFVKDGAVRYVANVYMSGEYPMATLTDQQTGAQTIYYNNYYGYDEADPDAKYYQVINQVYDYANGYSIYDLDADEYLDQEDKLPYLYEKLSELGDYRQTLEFLDRFTVVPSKLTEVKKFRTDKLNNVSEDWLTRYGYDENGTMIWARGEDVSELTGVYETWSTQNLTYDANGKLSEVTIGSTGNLSALGTPIYDTAGKMVGMEVQKSSSEYTSVFTYDAEGRCICLEFPEGDSFSYPITYDYTYDDAGKLITKVRTSGYQGRTSVTSTYTYEGDVLVELREDYVEWSDEYTVTYTYTSDEQGRPLTAVITTTDPDNTYKAQEIEYVYKDLYFFDDTGLVEAEG